MPRSRSTITRDSVFVRHLRGGDIEAPRKVPQATQPANSGLACKEESQRPRPEQCQAIRKGGWRSTRSALFAPLIKAAMDQASPAQAGIPHRGG